MNITPRQKRILLLLLQKEIPSKLSDLANSIGVSERTIQRELDAVNFYLKSYHCAIIREKGVGISLKGSIEAKDNLIRDLSGLDEVDASDIDQRRKVLLLELFRDRSPKKIYTFSQRLGVSESTIAKDLEALQPWLDKNHLTIVKRPGYGVTLKGSESDYREAMQRFINENTDEYFRDRNINEALSQAIFDSTDQSILGLMDFKHIARVQDVLNELNDPKFEQFTDHAYLALVLHIAIAVARIEKGGIIDSEMPLEDWESYEGYSLAMDIKQSIEKEFNITMPQSEISYLLLHIEGSKINYSESLDSKSHINQDEEELLDLIDAMIDAYDPSLKSSLKQDGIFVRGLMIHLQPVIIRLKNKMNIFNPLLAQVKSEYPETFYKSRLAANVIAEHFGFEVSDEEVAYLAMHFGTAEERLKDRLTTVRKVNIGVVCASGFGVARLMMTKLAKELGNSVNLQTFGTNDIGTDDSIDFYVTSFDLKDYNVDYIQINPLIIHTDVQKIRAKTDDYSHIVNNNVEIKNFDERLSDIEFLTKEIQRLISTYQDIKCPDESTMEQIIHIASNTYYQGDQAKYIEDKINQREKMGSQIFADYHIALFHCQAPVKESVILSFHAQGNGFTDDIMKEVQSVLFMVIPEDIQLKNNQKLFGHISSSLIQNPEFLQAIHSGDQERIRDELKQILQIYFYQYIQEI